MSAEENISRSLAELCRLTGLKLSFSQETDDPEDVAEKLAMLTAAYREKYDRSNFIRNLLGGNVQDADIYAAASKFHIVENGRRAVFVIDCENNSAEKAEKILKALFLSGSGDLQAVLDARRAVLIRSLKKSEGGEELNSLARMIVDMLNAEAMIRVRVGYGRITESLREMPGAFREALLSLEIGRIFYSSETVLCYMKLGIGRLIHSIPESEARLYIRELFGDGNPDDFDEETKSIIDAFFENNLNIAETARQLYVHRNTLVYRLEKMHQMTGFDLRNFDDAVALKIAMMIMRSLKDREEKKHEAL